MLAIDEGKLATLKALFGTDDMSLGKRSLRVRDKTYPVVDGVIVLSRPESWTPKVWAAVGGGPRGGTAAGLEEDVQYSFGREWETYDRVLPEHADEFRRYFDLVDLDGLKDARVCDLGCGIGRWSHFLTDRCRELVLVDFSDAIFVARRNLASAPNALFFMADLTDLPFVDDFCDFLFCLGVLHHLAVPCLEEARALRRWAPRALVFLYYALDNRPPHYRWLLRAVTAARLAACRVRVLSFRRAFSKAVARLVYRPLVALGSLLEAAAGLGRHVPLYEFYRDKSLGRIEQDVCDRFFTPVEQRVSRQRILALRDTFSRVTVSPSLPYWHFLLER